MRSVRQITAGRPALETGCQPVYALIDCVAPLVRELRARGLVSSYFFVNQWSDGYVQLRLRPTSPDHLDEVFRVAEVALSRFLARHPAATRGTPAVDRLELLYTDQERRWISGATSVPPSGRAGARLSYRSYQPDYDTYGGPAGVDLAEWHFEHSSDQVLELARSVGSSSSSTRLGLAVQLMMVLTAAFLPEVDELAGYLASRGGGAAGATTPDAEWERAAPALRRRFGEIRTAVAAHQLDGTGEEGCAVLAAAASVEGWARHCQQLRERVLELDQAGVFVFPGAAGTRGTTLVRLLTPYLRATNNRLGVSLADEVHLARLLARALPLA